MTTKAGLDLFDLFKQKSPCNDCPFRREGGVRHSRDMLSSYIDYFTTYPGATFPCHKSVQSDDDRTKWSPWREGQVLCAGGLIFALKQGSINQVMSTGLLLKEYDPAQHPADAVEAVFDSAEEMLKGSD